MRTFDEYHEAVKASALPQFPNFGDNILYPALGAVDEASEIAEKVERLTGKIAGFVKKLWRDHGITHNHQFEFEDVHISEEALNLREGIRKEIGDVLWYLDALAFTVGTSLSECAQANVAKLTGRAERGTSLGSGDDR